MIQNINKIINSQLTNSDIQKYLYRKGIDTYYENICNNKDTNLNLYKRFQRLFDERNKLLLEAQKKECELVLLNNR